MTACIRLVALAVLLSFYRPALAGPPLPSPNPAREQAPAAQTPELLGEAPTVAWSEAEVAAAKATCTELLEAVTIDYDPLDPIKEGLCGAPAPILVRSIGTGPKVEIDPPATLTCKVAHALDGWLIKAVQPEAKARLGAEVVGLRNAASYVCRNRNGDANGLISQHAFANALDISEFVLASGERITVLESWPKAADEPATGEPPKPLSNPFVETKSARPPQPPPQATPPPAHDVSPQSRFVRAMHETACRNFGTVLGPDANEAHKDHFHLDMKPRRRSNFCE